MLGANHQSIHQLMHINDYFGEFDDAVDQLPMDLIVNNDKILPVHSSTAQAASAATADLGDRFDKMFDKFMIG